MLHRHHAGDAVDMYERVAERARHPGVHLGEHQVGALDGGPHHIHRDAEAHVAVRIGRAHLDERDIDPDPTAADELGDLGQEHRDEVRPALLHRLAHVGPDEERRVPESVGVLAGDVGRRPERHQMNDLVVGEVLAVLHQRGDQPDRADEDATAGTDECDGLLGGGDTGAGDHCSPQRCKGQAMAMPSGRRRS